MKKKLHLVLYTWFIFPIKRNFKNCFIILEIYIVCNNKKNVAVSFIHIEYTQNSEQQ